MTRPGRHKFCLEKRILHSGDSGFEVQTSSESFNVTVVVTVEIHDEPGSRVDHDHDTLLREFMEAGDE
jgi:hypothetical protein